MTLLRSLVMHDCRCHRRTQFWPLAVALLIATCGCTTVETRTQPAAVTDRSAAGGKIEPGDPAAPADKVVVAAANGQMVDPADKSATKNQSAKNKRSTATLSETREQRLREVATEFDRHRDEAQYQAALNRWREDDAAGCRESLEHLLARNSSHCPGRLLFAQVCLSDGNAKGALEQVRQVLALQPQNAEAHHLMGVALDALGETGPAIAEYEKATRLDSQNEEYAACYHAALDSLAAPAGAISQSVPAAAPQPNDSAGSAASRDSRANTGPAGRTGNAGPDGRVVQVSGASPAPIDYDKSTDADQAACHAIEALRDNRPHDAAQISSAALAEHPRSAALFRVLGAAQYRLGNYNAAQVAIGQALSLDKSDALTYFLMGSTLARLGQNQAAERQFSEAARLDPRYSRHD